MSSSTSKSSGSPGSGRRKQRAEQPLLAASLPSATGSNSGDRFRLEAEWLALQEQEQNLRAYEVQLRAMQADIDLRREQDLPTSISPFPAGELSLQSAWDKLIRARELLDSEQSHFRDERLVMKAERAEIKRRLAQLDAREAALSAREEALSPSRSSKGGGGNQAVGERKASVMTRLSRNPFDFARSVLGRGKKSLAPV
jgi:hypothetical protein